MEISPDPSLRSGNRGHATPVCPAVAAAIAAAPVSSSHSGPLVLSCAAPNVIILDDNRPMRSSGRCVCAAVLSRTVTNASAFATDTSAGRAPPADPRYSGLQ